MKWAAELTEWANKAPPWITLLVVVAGLAVAVWARLSARKAIKVSMRPELYRLRSCWQEEIQPQLVGRGGALDPDKFAAFSRLLSDSRLLSKDLYSSLRRAYDLANTITSMEAIGRGPGEPSRHPRWLQLQEQMKFVEASFDKLLPIKL